MSTTTTVQQELQFSNVISRLSRKKPWEHLQNFDSETSKLKKTLTWYDLLLFGVGGIIGAGVYVLSGLVANTYAGPALVISFLISGTFCIFSALCFAEFGSWAAGGVGASGSTYAFAYLTLGEFAAFVLGWDLILEYGISAAAIARGWSSYVAKFFELCGAKFPDWLASGVEFGSVKNQSNPDASMGNFNLLAMLLIIILTVMIIVGVKETAIVQDLLTISKLVILTIVILAGSSLVDTKNWTPFAPFGSEGIWNGAAILFFAFIGFDAVTVTSEEAKNPKRDIPIGVIGSLLISTAFYIAVALVITGLASYDTINTDAPLAGVFQDKGWNWAAILVSLGGITGLASTTLASLFPQTRIFYAMARDGMFFKVFAHTSAKTGTPIWGSLITGFLTMVVAALISIDDLANATTIGTLFAYTFVNGSILIMRFRGQHLTEAGLGGSWRHKICKYIIPMVFLLVIAQFLVSFVGLYSGATLYGVFTAPSDGARAAVGAIFGIMMVVLGVLFMIMPQNVVPAKFHMAWPFVPIVPFFGMWANLYLMTQLDYESWIRFIIWLAVGQIIYWGYGFWHSKLRYSTPESSGVSMSTIVTKIDPEMNKVTTTKTIVYPVTSTA